MAEIYDIKTRERIDNKILLIEMGKVKTSNGLHYHARLFDLFTMELLESFNTHVCTTKKETLLDLARECTHTMFPFERNKPPFVGYQLLTEISPEFGAFLRTNSLNWHQEEPTAYGSINNYEKRNLLAFLKKEFSYKSELFL